MSSGTRSPWTATESAGMLEKPRTPATTGPSISTRGTPTPNGASVASARPGPRSLPPRRPALSVLPTEPDEVVRMTDVSGAIPAHPDSGQ